MKKTNGGYTSCIKINGNPILPPLLSPERRKEMQHYKRQALKIENRLSERTQIVFNDDWKILPAFKNNVTIDLPKSAIINNYVGDETISNASENKLNLTCDVQASQYINNEFDIVATDPPKLIRSNSYTLIAPSPVLLENMAKLKTDLDDDDNTILNESIDCELLDTSCTDTELKNISDNESNLHDFLTNNVPENDNKSEDPVKMLFLRDVLDKLPDEYSKQIKLLLERKSDKSRLSSEFTRLYEHPEKFSTPNGDYSNNQTIFYSADDSYNFDYAQAPNEEKPLEKQLNEQKAAVILTAAVRGFLTRCLLRTDKVQAIIRTIKDVFLCAVQLHKENIETIEESDVELHRRLIQQVSAAYYSIHDVFFETTIEERMLIISMDRQKKNRRLLSSAGSNVSVKSTSNRSSTPIIKRT